MLDINIKIRLLLYNCQDRLRQWVLIMAVLNLRILLSGSFIQINFRKIGFRDGTSMELALTLRRLMSYIYMEHPFLMFLDHTQRRSTVGRTPLDE